MRKFWLFLSSVTAVAGVTACRGFLELFSATPYHDDTGFMLTLIRGFNERGQLYHATFSPYGPFYSEFYYFNCGLLGVPITHDAIRWVVLAIWVFSSIAGAIIAFRFTSRIWVALIAQLVCFHVLNLLAREPGHPISLIVACLAMIALCLGAAANGLQPKPWHAVMIGTLLGALFMTKINLGVFAVAAIGTAWVLCSPLDWPGKMLRGVVAILFCLQVLLVKRGWPFEVEIYFAVLFICSSLSVFISMGCQARNWLAWGRFTLWALAAVFLTCALSLSGALLTGSSWPDLFDGIIRQPMRLGTLFTAVPSLGPTALINAMLGLVLALAWRALPSAFLPYQSRVIFGLRILFLIIFIVWFATTLDYFTWIFPFLWIAAVPPAQNNSAPRTGLKQFARLSFVLLAVAQFLGLYPVSGSQVVVPIYLGSLSALLVIEALLVDLTTTARHSSALRISVIAVNLSLAVVLVYLFGWVIYLGAIQYHRLSSLNLPGAKLLRIEEIPAASYRFLAANLRHCRPSFLTVPGLNSLYLWSEKDPSTGFETPLNFVLLSLEQQRAMVNVARKCQPIAAVFNRERLQFWTRGNLQPSGPLIDFVTTECRSVGRVRSYELMVLRDAPPPVLTYCAMLNREWQIDAPDNEITVSLPANFQNVTNVYLLHISSRKMTRRRMEAVITSKAPQTAATVPTNEPRLISFYVDNPKGLSRDLLDETLVQLGDESDRIIKLPFLRPPDR